MDDMSEARRSEILASIAEDDQKIGSIVEEGADPNMNLEPSDDVCELAMRYANAFKDVRAYERQLDYKAAEFLTKYGGGKENTVERREQLNMIFAKGFLSSVYLGDARRLVIRLVNIVLAEGIVTHMFVTHVLLFNGVHFLQVFMYQGNITCGTYKILNFGTISAPRTNLCVMLKRV